MLKLTENQIRLLIRNILMEKIDPDKYNKQGGGMSNHPGSSLAPGETLGTNPSGDWRQADTGEGDFGDELGEGDDADDEDSLDEVDEDEEE